MSDPPTLGIPLHTSARLLTLSLLNPSAHPSSSLPPSLQYYHSLLQISLLSIAVPAAAGALAYSLLRSRRLDRQKIQFCIFQVLRLAGPRRFAAARVTGAQGANMRGGVEDDGVREWLERLDRETDTLVHGTDNECRLGSGNLGEWLGLLPIRGESRLLTERKEAAVRRGVKRAPWDDVREKLAKENDALKRGRETKRRRLDAEARRSDASKNSSSSDSGSNEDGDGDEGRNQGRVRSETRVALGTTRVPSPPTRPARRGRAPSHPVRSATPAPAPARSGRRSTRAPSTSRSGRSATPAPTPAAAPAQLPAATQSSSWFPELLRHMNPFYGSSLLSWSSGNSGNANGDSTADSDEQEGEHTEKAGGVVIPPRRRTASLPPRSSRTRAAAPSPPPQGDEEEEEEPILERDYFTRLQSRLQPVASGSGSGPAVASSSGTRRQPRARMSTEERMAYDEDHWKKAIEERLAARMEQRRQERQRERERKRRQEQEEPNLPEEEYVGKGKGKGKARADAVVEAPSDSLAHSPGRSPGRSVSAGTGSVERSARGGEASATGTRRPVDATPRPGAGTSRLSVSPPEATPRPTGTTSRTTGVTPPTVEATSGTPGRTPRPGSSGTTQPGAPPGTARPDRTIPYDRDSLQEPFEFFAPSPDRHPNSASSRAATPAATPATGRTTCVATSGVQTEGTAPIPGPTRTGSSAGLPNNPLSKTRRPVQRDETWNEEVGITFAPQNEGEQEPTRRPACTSASAASTGTGSPAPARARAGRPAAPNTVTRRITRAATAAAQTSTSQPAVQAAPAAPATGAPSRTGTTTTRQATPAPPVLPTITISTATEGEDDGSEYEADPLAARLESNTSARPVSRGSRNPVSRLRITAPFRPSPLRNQYALTIDSDQEGEDDGAEAPISMDDAEEMVSEMTPSPPQQAEQPRSSLFWVTGFRDRTMGEMGRRWGGGFRVRQAVKESEKPKQIEGSKVAVKRKERTDDNDEAGTVSVHPAVKKSRTTTTVTQQVRTTTRPAIITRTTATTRAATTIAAITRATTTTTRTAATARATPAPRTSASPNTNAAFANANRRPTQALQPVREEDELEEDEIEEGEDQGEEEEEEEEDEVIDAFTGEYISILDAPHARARDGFYVPVVMTGALPAGTAPPYVPERLPPPTFYYEEEEEEEQ